LVFLRSKIVKGKSYSYLVKSKWDVKRKTSIQETVKYLGKTSRISMDDIPHEYQYSPAILAFLANNKKIDAEGREKFILKIKKNTLKFLLSGDLDDLRLVFKNFRKTGTIPEFYEKILRPAMYDIGGLWRDGKLDVGSEHVASNTATHLIESMNTNLKSKSKPKTVLVCTPEGEYHIIPCLMIETYLSLKGYNVINLAPSVPTKSLINHIDKEKPDLVLVSITLDEHVKAGMQLVKNIKKLKIPIIVGGQALKDNKYNFGVTVSAAPNFSELSKAVKMEIAQR
jgi:methanogenic corrinoid protein MtbC1